MADNFTQLAGMLQSPLFGQNVINKSTKTNRFLASGILTPDAQFGAHLLDSTEDYMTLPFTNDLAGDPDPWTDLADIEVSNVTTGKQRAMRMRLVKAFGYTDIAQEFSVSDPANVIAANFSDFWARAEQKMLVHMLAGVFSNTDIATAKLFDDSAKQFGPRGFLATIGLLGDLQDQTFSKIAVNSSAYSEMKAQQMIDTAKPNEAVGPFGNYNGMQIVVDDDLPLDENGVATSYIFGNGSVGYSVANPASSTEVEREARKNGGRTNVINRRVETMHVMGTSVVPSFHSAGQTVTMAELASPDTWEVVKDVDPRNIKVVAYKAKVSTEFLPKKKASSGSGSGSGTTTGK